MTKQTTSFRNFANEPKEYAYEITMQTTRAYRRANSKFEKRDRFSRKLPIDVKPLKIPTPLTVLFSAISDINMETVQTYEEEGTL
jgi:hypothetical protein